MWYRDWILAMQRVEDTERQLRAVAARAAALDGSPAPASAVEQLRGLGAGGLRRLAALIVRISDRLAPVCREADANLTRRHAI